METTIQPTSVIKPLHHETETKAYMDIYRDGVLYDSIKEIRLIRFDNEGNRLYEVSVDGVTFYPIPYAFVVPYDATGKDINMMITHAKFNQY